MMLAATPPAVMRTEPAPEQASPYTVDASVVVQVVCDDGWATAFYLGDGKFMTARHVVEGRGHPICSINDKVVSVVSEGRDANHDWAIVYAPISLPYKVIYSCQHMRAGDYYLASGYAMGHDWLVTDTMRASGTVDWDGTREVRGNVIPAMSGGPVSDLQGVVYAINSWYLTDQGHALPLSGVLELANTGLCPKGRK